MKQKRKQLEKFKKFKPEKVDILNFDNRIIKDE